MSNRKEIKEEHGQLLLEWDFDEYVKQKRGPAWYVIAGILFVLAVIYSVISRNFLFLLILILLVFIIIVRSRQTPLKVNLKIFEDGVQIGSRFYEWRDLKRFRVVYEPPQVKRLYFDIRSIFSPDFSVPLEDQNPLKVREILKKYLPEDLTAEYETIFDKINRWLKI